PIGRGSRAASRRRTPESLRRGPRRSAATASFPFHLSVAVAKPVAERAPIVDMDPRLRLHLRDAWIAKPDVQGELSDAVLQEEAIERLDGDGAVFGEVFAHVARGLGDRGVDQRIDLALSVRGID